MFLIVLHDGRVIYSKVIAFLEKHPNMISQYKAITTYSNETTILSENHLIYARKGSVEKFTPM